MGLEQVGVALVAAQAEVLPPPQHQSTNCPPSAFECSREPRPEFVDEALIVSRSHARRALSSAKSIELTSAMSDSLGS